MTAVAPYGSWKSPIEAAAVARSWIAPMEVQVDGDALWWLEQRPAEGGRQVACRWTSTLLPDSARTAASLPGCSGITQACSGTAPNYGSPT